MCQSTNVGEINHLYYVLESRVCTTIHLIDSRSCHTNVSTGLPLPVFAQVCFQQYIVKVGIGWKITTLVFDNSLLSPLHLVLILKKYNM